MEGCLLHIGRILSPRFLLFSLFLLFISTASVQAKSVVIGSGSGSLYVSGMSGLNPGDSLKIAPGQYKGGIFNFLKGITITNNGGTVIFTGQVTLNTLVECEFSGFQFKNVQGISIRWDGNSRRCVEKNIFFMDCNGSANDAADHNVYNGDTSSLKLYMCTFDSLTLFRSGMVLMGGWGEAKDLACFMDSIVLSRIKIDSTLSNGTEVRGIIFRIDAHDWRVTYKGINNIQGDVGIFYFDGNGSIHNIYRFGGRGYIARIWNVGLKVPGNTYFYNNIDLNSTNYGSIDTRVDPVEFTKYTTGANCYIFNNTSGNKEDHMGYWSALAVVGTFSPPWICQTRNNLGFNLQTNGKPKITMNQSSQTWVSDSSNNMYFDKPDGVVDPVTGIPTDNSPVLGKGLTLAIVKEDIYHTPRQGAYDIGAVQHGGPVIPPPPNQPPVALTGAAQTITLPASNTILDGTKSYDPDGSISSYAWVLVSGTGGSLATPGAASTKVSGLTAGTYIYKLTVTDNSNDSAFAMDTLVVNPAGNLPPIANAGADQIINQPASSATVNGSASKDQDNGGLISAYAWSQSSGPSLAGINAATNVSTTISGLQLGVYVFKLTVTDASGSTAVDSLTVSVKAPANIPPVANAGTSKTITLPADSVTLDGSLSADPDGSIASYNWAQISGPAASVIGNATMVITPASQLVAGQYIFELTTTDNGGAVSKSQVKITVVNSGLQPPIANAGANQNIVLPLNQVTLDGTASSATSGTISVYQWTQTSGPSTATLSAAGSASTSAADLVAGIYIFQLLIKDNNQVTATDSVIITVNPAVNIAPVANAGSSITVILPDNAATLDGSGSSDVDGTISSYQWTKISGPNNPGSTGDNTALLALTGLVAGQYNYQLQVTDNGGISAYSQVKITVVAPPNVLPVANAGSDQTITAPSNTVNLDGTASYDPDGTIASYNWVLISGPNQATISNANTIKPAVSGLIPGQYIFQLSVTDNNGGSHADPVNITVNQEPSLPNQPPVANAGKSLTITAPASSIDLNGSSSFDPDGTIVYYDWSQVSGPSVATIANNGTVKPAVSGLIVGSYTFKLMVADNSGSTTYDQVIVTVQAAPNKINQQPVAFAGSDTTIYLPATAYTLNAAGSYDPDGNIIAYQWQEISGPNTVLTSLENNPQAGISNLQVGLYQFQLTVTDNEGSSSTARITVSVDKASVSGDQLIVYPNPAHEIIHAKLTSSVSGTVRINVYDMNGRLVLANQSEKSLDIFEKSLQISTLSPGVYTIQLNIANRKSMVTKFVKQ